MNHTKEVLDRLTLQAAGARHQINWSDARLSELKRLADGEFRPKNDIDGALATPLLLCAAGDFCLAERQIIEVLTRQLGTCLTDTQVFSSLVLALFAVQRLDLVCSMLYDRDGFSQPFEILAEENGLGAMCVRWEISANRTHRFIFDSSVFRDDLTTHRIHQFQREFPLLANYAAQPEQETGTLVLNQFDLGLVPGLAYCQSRPDFFLIPDCIFVPTKGYAYVRKVFDERRVRWEDKEPVAFWRGSTTGPKASPNDWQSLERVRLCEIALKNRHTGLIDAGLTKVVQFSDERVSEEIRRAGLMKDFVPWESWSGYKYLIDIDGNSSPWSNTFQRLLTGSALLKVESPRGLRQWFYDDLIPWVNYVPVAPDRSDLIDKVRWLRENDSFAARIGLQGLELARRLTYESEMRRSVPVISAGFRYFRKECVLSQPFGQPEKRA